MADHVMPSLVLGRLLRVTLIPPAKFAGVSLPVALHTR
jgi:hypothetical protein